MKRQKWHAQLRISYTIVRIYVEVCIYIFRVLEWEKSNHEVQRMVTTGLEWLPASMGWSRLWRDCSTSTASG